MTYRDVFRKLNIPRRTTITGKTSTITGAFVGSILPSIEPQEDEIQECLKILELDANDLQCVYCGDPATDWDHLRALVSKKKPTGYVSEIRNLVPACGKCNESRGNKNWDDWITSNAKKSPKMRKVKDLDVRIRRLKRYEKWGGVSKINFEKDVDKKLLNQHWQNLENMHKEMERCQKLADQIRTEMENKLLAAKLTN